MAASAVVVAVGAQWDIAVAAVRLVEEHAWDSVVAGRTAAEGGRTTACFDSHRAGGDHVLPAAAGGAGLARQLQGVPLVTFAGKAGMTAYQAEEVGWAVAGSDHCTLHRRRPHGSRCHTSMRGRHVGVECGTDGIVLAVVGRTAAARTVASVAEVAAAEDAVMGELRMKAAAGDN